MTRKRNKTLVFWCELAFPDEDTPPWMYGSYDQRIARISNELDRIIKEQDVAFYAITTDFDSDGRKPRGCIEVYAWRKYDKQRW